MNSKYIDELTKLEMESKHLKRCLDIAYYNKEQRKRYFERLNEIKKEIEHLKFKIRLQKEVNNGKNTSN